MLLRLIIVSLLFSILGVSAKDFDLDKLTNFDDKNQIQINKEKNVFILFWATWCTTCKVKLTERIPKFRKKYKNTHFIALNIDKDLGRVKHYIDKNEIKEKVAIDPQGVLTKKLNNNVAPYWASFEFNAKSGKWKLLKGESGFEEKNFLKYLK
jgi:thiol-disulfide isomerase/thioredoxin